jgi:hypothetical protein
MAETLDPVCLAEVYTSCQTNKRTPRCFSAVSNSVLFIMCFGITDRDGSGIKGLHVKSLTGLPHKSGSRRKTTAVFTHCQNSSSFLIHE